MEYNILLTGVGGQGLITLARLIASSLLENDINTIVAETHGMSQRGGSVLVHVRVGDVFSPLSPIGGTDLMVGLELIEAVRQIEYLHKDSKAILNDYTLKPGIPNVRMPKNEDLINVFRENKISYYVIPAQRLAIEAGNEIVANVVMLGSLVASGLIPGLEKDNVLTLLNGLRFKELNISAFNKGYEYFKTNYL